MAMLLPLPAAAQFYGNAVPAELLDQSDGIVWFGAVRNAHGDFVADATVMLDTSMIEFVAVTGIEGRFRLVLPEDQAITDVTPSCARADYRQAAMTLRVPRAGKVSPVELTCVLR